MKKGELTSNDTAIQKIIGEFYEKLYTNKLNSLEEMDMFLEMYNLPKLNWEEIYNLNRLSTRSELESAI